jgi:hypothetical protein
LQGWHDWLEEAGPQQAQGEGQGWSCKGCKGIDMMTLFALFTMMLEGLRGV